MKNFIASIILILLFSVNSYTKNLPLSTPHFSISSSILVDENTSTFYIDLVELNETITVFVIKEANNVLYIEDISKASTSDIIEFNYAFLKSGKYTLELVTKSGIKISKNFSK